MRTATYKYTFSIQPQLYATHILKTLYRPFSFPPGNKGGTPPGYTCVAIAGPGGCESGRTMETGSSDRYANMVSFAVAGVEELEKCVLGTVETGKC